MNLFQAIIMGIVQGLSEFLPISSSGHLVFTSNIYKMIENVEFLHSNQEVFLDIMLHLGTLVAVLIYFRSEILEVIKSTFYILKIRKVENEESKVGLYIILGTIITILIAYPLNKIAASLVFQPKLVAILLFLTGILLIVSEKISKRIEEKKELTLEKSILIAIAQGIAALPGFSRSGLTIATALLLGISREKAAKYSFLLSIPIILGASMVYPFVGFNISETTSYNWTAIMVGTFVSAVVGYLSIKYFMKFLSKFSLIVFGIYCLIISAIMFLLFL